MDIRRISITLASLLFCGSAAAQTVNNPSFETLGQVGWTGLLSGPAAWNDLATSPPTTNGVNGVQANQILASSQILYQDVTLPATGMYTFRVDANCVPLGGTANDFCRVDITNTNAATLTMPVPGVDTLATTGGNVVAPVFSLDGTGVVTPQAARSATFTGGAGQVVRIRFMALASNNVANLNIDNVAFAPAGAAAAAPTMSEWALILMALLIASTAAIHLRRR